jgi:thymidylate kinase
MIIAFSGLDGAGKSTQIEILKFELLKRGKRVKIVWARGGYTKGIEFLKASIRKLMPHSTPKPGRSKHRDESFSNPILRKTWLYVAIIDLFLLYVVIFRLHRIMGIYIIADRYLIDTKIDFMLNFPQEKVEKWLLWKLFVMVAPKPNKHFIAMIPVQESIKRSKLKNEPFPDSEEVLCIRKNRYSELLKTNKDVVEVNGLFSIDEIHNKILNHLDFENITSK